MNYSLKKGFYIAITKSVITLFRVFYHSKSCCPALTVEIHSFTFREYGTASTFTGILNAASTAYRIMIEVSLLNPFILYTKMVMISTLFKIKLKY